MIGLEAESRILLKSLANRGQPKACWVVEGMG